MRKNTPRFSLTVLLLLFLSSLLNSRDRTVIVVRVGILVCVVVIVICDHTVVLGRPEGDECCKNNLSLF
jgi:hypothetical protein